MVATTDLLAKYKVKTKTRFNCGIHIDNKCIITSIWDSRNNDFVFHGKHKRNMQSSVMKAIKVLWDDITFIEEKPE